MFLGAGSVIHSLKDEQNINHMGGIWRKLPYTYVLMIIGTLALTGFPFLSGYYSKDAIIEFAYIERGTFSNYAAAIGIITAFLTSIYSWRLIFKIFHGKYNNKKINLNEIHDSPFIMLAPLFVLSIGAIFSGILFKGLLIGIDSSYLFWGDSIKFLEPLSSDHPPVWFLILTPILVILSIPLSYLFFIKDRSIIDRFVKINLPLYTFLKNKWYFDELYNYLFVRPTTIQSDIEVEYVRKPVDVVWGFTVGSLGQYVYNTAVFNAATNTGSQDFELDISEQTEVILRILMYSGIIIKDPQIVQAAAQQVQMDEINKKS